MTETGMSDLNGCPTDPVVVIRRLPENKDEELRAALRQALGPDGQGVLVVGTMHNKKLCPTPPGLKFMDDKEFSATKTPPSAFGVLVLLTSSAHRVTDKTKIHLPDGVRVFSQISGNQLRRALKSLNYEPELASPVPPPPVPPPPLPVPTPPKLQQFGIKRVCAVIKETVDICRGLTLDQTTELVLNRIQELGGKANPTVVRDMIEKFRADADTGKLLKAIDADEALEQCFKELDNVVRRIKRRFRELITEEHNRHER